MHPLHPSLRLSCFYTVVENALAQLGNPVIEIRKYTAHDGKLGALVKRMGEGEARMFEKHGMKNVFHCCVSR